jgi:hypothetical protein
VARFTDRQVEDAKHTDLAAYLRQQGEKLVPSGREFRWVYRDGSGEHDSVTVRGNEWFDHKRQIGGDAIGFLQEFYGMDFREAVASLLHQNPGGIIHKTAFPEPERKPFALPPKAPNMHRLFAYLCKTRGIDHNVVTHFVRAGALYEDAERHNAVFVATDEQNKPVGGMKKSTLSGSSFRQTIEGSDTRYAFHHRGASGRVFVFEAAVDMLSYITMYPQNWERHSYIALDGVSSIPLRHFLSVNPGVSEICLCLDNDEGGIKAARRITDQLRDDGYTEITALMPQYKDWNDALTAQLREPILDLTGW